MVTVDGCQCGKYAPYSSVRLLDTPTHVFLRVLSQVMGLGYVLLRGKLSHQ